MKQTRSPLYPIFLFVIINLIIFTLSRLGLAIWQADRVSAVEGWGQLFLQGFAYGYRSLMLFIWCASIIYSAISSLVEFGK